MAPRSSWILAALVATLIPASAAAQKITRGPYLQQVTPTSIYVVWDQDKASAAEVRFGLTKSYTGKVASSSKGTHHEVKVTGLTPNSTYYYAVYQGTAKLSADLTLPSGVNSGTPFRFVVLGDTRSDKVAHGNMVTAISLEPKVRYYINTGDLVSSGEIQKEWDEFFQIEKMVLSHMPLYPVIGNHDEKSGKAPIYKKHFVLPANSPDPEEYYSFDYGNVHFIALDGHINVDEWYLCALKLKFYDGCFDDKQAAWVTKDLKAAAADSKIDHIFVLIHMGPYSSKPGRMGYAQMRDLMATFKTHKVTMVISGHDHYYEHGVSPNGIHYAISGGGGAPLYAIGPPSLLVPHKVIYNKSGYHYLVIDVNGKYVHVQAKDQKGKKMEEFFFGAPPKPTPDGGVDGAVADAGVTPDQAALLDGAAVTLDAPTLDAAGTTVDGPGVDTSATTADQAASADTGATPPPGTEEEGCSCSTTGEAPPAGLLLLLLGVSILRRRASWA